MNACNCEGLVSVHTGHALAFKMHGLLDMIFERLTTPYKFSIMEFICKFIIITT